MSDDQTTDANDQQTTNGNVPDKNGNGGNDSQTVTMTQAELDEAIERRVARLKRNFNDEFLKELGVDTLETAKQKLSAVKEREEADKSELQKAQDALVAEQNRVKALEESQSKREAEIRLERLDSAILGAVKEADALDPDEVMILLKAQGIDNLMDDEGKPKTADITKLVNTHRDTKAHLYKPKRHTPGSPSNADGTSGTGKQDKIAAAQRQFQAVLNKGT